MKHNNALIAIAVANYNGHYKNLPGTINSAKKLVKWAQEIEDYEVLFLNDLEHEINIDFIQKEFNQFINNKVIDRLIIYFAGHGSVRTIGDQYWLLPNICNDISQCIDVEGLRRGASKINLGLNSNTPGQLCIISDSCRTSSTASIDFRGSPIITLRSPSKIVHFDKFYSTILGNYSYHNSKNNEALCYFTEALVQGLTLCVDKNEYLELLCNDPKGITNYGLANYLELQMLRIANQIKKEIIPDLNTGFRPPNNLYTKFDKNLVQKLVSYFGSDFIKSDVSITSEITESNLNRKEHLIDKQVVLKVVSKEENTSNLLDQIKKELKNIKLVFEGNLHTILITDIDFKDIHIPKGIRFEKSTLSNKYNKIESHANFGRPIFLQNKNKVIYVPFYPNMATIIINDHPKNILFYTGQDFITTFGHISLNKLTIPRVSKDAVELADKLRYEKFKFPYYSIEAAYIYEFANDFKNILRMSHFMANQIYYIDGKKLPILPFDTALLSNSNIYWEEEAGHINAYTDLDFVEAEVNNLERPLYTTSRFNEKKRILLWGITPMYSQGWNFINQSSLMILPKKLQELKNILFADNYTRDKIEEILGNLNYKKL